MIWWTLKWKSIGISFTWQRWRLNCNTIDWWSWRLNCNTIDWSWNCNTINWWSWSFNCNTIDCWSLSIWHSLFDELLIFFHDIIISILRSIAVKTEVTIIVDFFEYLFKINRC